MPTSRTGAAPDAGGPQPGRPGYWTVRDSTTMSNTKCTVGSPPAVAGVSKRLTRTTTGWLLQAANPDFADIPVGDKSELNIWGVVTRVIHAV